MKVPEIIFKKCKQFFIKFKLPVILLTAIVLGTIICIVYIPTTSHSQTQIETVPRINKSATMSTYSAKPPSLEDYLAYINKRKPKEEKAEEGEVIDFTTSEHPTEATGYTGESTGTPNNGGGIGNLGDVGRLVIPGLGISVALNSTGGTAQNIVDWWDSAFYYYHAWNGKEVTEILDHCDQAFAPLSGSYVGMTGTIYYHGYSQPIVCIDVRNGTSDLRTRYINGTTVLEYYPGAIVMSTCGADCYHVILSVWAFGSSPISVTSLQQKYQKQPETTKPTTQKPTEKPTTKPQDTTRQPETTTKPEESTSIAIQETTTVPPTTQQPPTEPEPTTPESNTPEPEGTVSPENENS